ncbi:4-hydroxybenzoate octaprenyltransferase [Magnetofaba australis]|uniref:4-hydroxybenzoate octaprenyltransferase n=1 Tax=Magnetofaba australis IT-1 TaxID=1434232 RepID=A0A1Y2K026_9PROT|nr:4-hydroxybenzoate octaprenyltransferase [Magnetofaba australis]OSM01378.1 putative 4-hydroxybenzoate octaprenyltransferase [Magnetofaba australis IT-1]
MWNIAQTVDAIPFPLLRESLRLMRVDKPIGTWLVFWPALWGVAAASFPAQPDWLLMAVFGIGAFVMRSAGCVINDIADRDFDPHVERTKQRPLAAGRISMRAAVGLLILLLVIALFLAFQLNWLALQLSVGGALLALTYPFTKRIIHTPQLYLGAAFGWAVIMAWAATAGAVTLDAWILFASILTWATGYDTLYGMVDREDDLKIGVKSTAIFFGRFDLAAVAGFYALTLLLWALFGWRLGFGWSYGIAWLGCAAHMALQIVRCRKRERDTLFNAFLSNSQLGLPLLLGILLAAY